MDITNIHKSILDCMSEAVYIVDRDMKILYTNPAAEILTEYSPEEALGETCYDIFCERSFRCDEICPPQKAMRERLPILHRDAETKTKSGSIKQTQISISPFFENDTCVGGIIVIKDISELKKAEEQIKRQNDFLTSVINSLPHPFYVIDAATYQVKIANAAAHVGPLPETATCHALSHGQTAPCSGKGHPCPLDLLKKTGKSVTVQHIHTDHEGNARAVEVHCHPIFDPAGNIIQFIEYNIDISERKLFEKRLEQLAFYDPLTGLPNRTLFFDRMRQAVSLAKRNRQALALLFLDLDRFKIVNDTLGHNAGDLVLQEMASRLKTCVRQSDTVARMGGDEFTVIITPVSEPQDAGKFSRKILNLVSEPCTVSGHELSMSGSIGISLYPSDGNDAETLLQKADIAMYLAKERRDNTYRFYPSEHNAPE